MFLNTYVTNIKLKGHTGDKHKFYQWKKQIFSIGGENMGLEKRMQLTLAEKFTHSNKQQVKHGFVYKSNLQE